MPLEAKLIRLPGSEKVIGTDWANRLQRRKQLLLACQKIKISATQLRTISGCWESSPAQRHGVCQPCLSPGEGFLCYFVEAKSQVTMELPWWSMAKNPLLRCRGQGSVLVRRLYPRDETQSSCHDERSQTPMCKNQDPQSQINI